MTTEETPTPGNPDPTPSQIVERLREAHLGGKLQTRLTHTGNGLIVSLLYIDEEGWEWAASDYIDASRVCTLYLDVTPTGRKRITYALSQKAFAYQAWERVE